MEDGESDGCFSNSTGADESNGCLSDSTGAGEVYGEIDDVFDYIGTSEAVIWCWGR